MNKQFLHFCMTLLFLFALTSTYAQIKITGNVKSVANEPMIGASVVENGTTNGTITDIDGNFELMVKDLTAILNVSFIGYQSKTVKINGIVHNLKTRAGTLQLRDENNEPIALHGFTAYFK